MPCYPHKEQISLHPLVIFSSPVKIDLQRPDTDIESLHYTFPTSSLRTSPPVKLHHLCICASHALATGSPIARIGPLQSRIRRIQPAVSRIPSVLAFWIFEPDSILYDCITRAVSHLQLYVFIKRERNCGGVVVYELFNADCQWEWDGYGHG